jgi:iron complex transport system substrate-binding protein
MAMKLALTALWLVLLVTGCQGAPDIHALKTATVDKPQRIVSLDYCADQYVLKLADRDQILALSPDADKQFSTMAGQAAGIPQVRAQAEDVLMLKPDLIVRSYGGGPQAEGFFARAGVPVAQLSFADTYDGIRANIMAMASAFGHTAHGTAIVSDFDARLAALQLGPRQPTALYMTPGGVTSGPGTLIDTMMTSAGLKNFQDSPGWNPLPLERLAHEKPDRVIAATFNRKATPESLWSAARHPIAQAQMSGQTALPLDGALTACGGWFVIDAIEQMAGHSPQPVSVRP